MPNKARIVSERVTQGHRQVSIVMDRCLGPFALLGAVLSVLSFIHGQASMACMIAFIAMPVLNILVTNLIGIRAKNPFRMELARSFGLNSILATAVYVLGQGPLVHYWPVFLTCSLWTAVVLFIWTRNLLACYLQTGYWVALFFFSNLYLGEQGMHWTAFIVFAALTMLVSIILVRMFDLLTVSLENEEQATNNLIHVSKMSALGEMAGGIAHEINTPLAIIGLKTEQILEMHENDLISATDLTEFLQTMLQTSDRIAKIVSGLRTFSRDGSRDDIQNVSLGKVINETLSLCAEMFKNSGVELRLDERADNLFFRGRSVEISQVLLNLISNAHDATKILTTKWVQISTFDRGDIIELQVTDSGVGIPLELQKKIFQPLFSTKEIGQGTGLGLSISLGIVKNHKGELLLDTDCENTRFVLRLPKENVMNAAA